MLNCNKISIFPNTNNNLYKASFKSTKEEKLEKLKKEQLKRDYINLNTKTLDDAAGISLITSFLFGISNISNLKKMSASKWIALGALASSIAFLSASLIKKDKLAKQYDKEFNV